MEYSISLLIVLPCPCGEPDGHGLDKYGRKNGDKPMNLFRRLLNGGFIR